MAPRILEWEAVGSHKLLAVVVTEQAVDVHTELVVVVVGNKMVGAENNSELVVVEEIRSELVGAANCTLEVGAGVANYTL